MIWNQGCYLRWGDIPTTFGLSGFLEPVYPVTSGASDLQNLQCESAYAFVSWQFVKMLYEDRSHRVTCWPVLFLSTEKVMMYILIPLTFYLQDLLFQVKLKKTYTSPPTPTPSLFIIQWFNGISYEGFVSCMQGITMALYTVCFQGFRVRIVFKNTA